MQYVVVPFTPSIGVADDLAVGASQLQALIDTYSQSGWEFMCIHRLTTFKVGTSGCFGIGAVPSREDSIQLAIFRQ